MLKIVLSLVILVSSSFAFAFDEVAFEKALEKAMIRADVKVLCGEEGQAFAKSMANSIRQAPQVANVKMDVKTTEKLAGRYENMCSNAIRNAFNHGLTEQEVLSVLGKEI